MKIIYRIILNNRRNISEQICLKVLILRIWFNIKTAFRKI